MTINTLTKKQEAMLEEYARKGIEIGLATGPDMDEQEVRSLTDAHRVMCDVAPAKEFIIYDSPMEACRKVEGLSTSNALYGQHDINWLMYNMFFRVELGLTEETEPIVKLFELAKRVGWMWMNETHTIVTRRPEEIHLRTTGTANGPFKLRVLHNETGKALKYRNGDGLYRLGGLEVAEHYITEPYDINKVMREKNTEIRNELLKMGGPDVLETQCDKKVLDTDTVANGGDYELYTIRIDNHSRTYLKGVCPSKGDSFNEAVPPSVTTVKQALSWREWGSVGLNMDYIIPAVRT